MRRIRKKLADAWEVVTCPKGHPCYVLVGPLYSESRFPALQLIPLEAQQPVGFGGVRCRVCCQLVFPRDRYNADRVETYISGQLRSAWVDDEQKADG